MNATTPSNSSLLALAGRLGSIREYTESRLRADDPRVFVILPRAATFQRFLGLETPTGSGAGFTREQAFRSAAGECLERYCVSCYDTRDLVYDSADHLGSSAIGFDQFEFYTPQQLSHPDFPFPHFQRYRPCFWSKGRNLATDEVRYVPACLSYLTYSEAAGDLFTLAVSTGTACHTVTDCAILNGLYEVIERDAFMIAWLCKLALPRINIASDPQLRALHRQHFAGAACEFHVFDMTTDFAIPSVFCVARGKSKGRTIFGVGAASRLSRREAVAKSMLEATTTLFFARSLLHSRPTFHPGANFDHVRTFADHVRLFCEADMAQHLDFLLNSEREIPVNDDNESLDPSAALAKCIERVQARGHQAIAVDLSTRDLTYAGLTCMKVFIPGTVPMTSIHGVQPIGSKRLRDVPHLLGYESPSRELNRIPHPFP